nr:MAG TPA: hypothetical protein [Caudoviricetes sp.]
MYYIYTRLIPKSIKQLWNEPTQKIRTVSTV